MGNYKLEVNNNSGSVLLMYRTEANLATAIKTVFDDYQKSEFISKVSITIPKKENIFGTTKKGG